MINVIIIIATVIIEAILGFMIIKNPNKFVGEGKPDTAIKIFIFIIISIMILALVYLTISGIKG